MGSMKNAEIEKQALWSIAEAVALRAGVLKQCSVCEDIIDDGGGEEIEAAYKLGNFLISNQEPLVEEFSGNRRLLTDTIQAVVHDHGPNCYCLRHADD